MLRPERMSKVSVAGSKAVMAEAIETIHDLNVLHVSDYDGSWEGFDNGSPVEGAEEASEKLVTVRSLESILGVTEEDAGPARIVDEDVGAKLETIREEVNELDDRRASVREQLRSVEERLRNAEPFVDLGIDLDLLDGYESLAVAVGEGDPEAVDEALATDGGVREHEVFGDGDVAAAFARPTDGSGADVLDDALVGVEFARLEVPDADGSPSSYVEELEHERRKLESRLDGVEKELEDARLEHGGFLLALEEQLSIEVQKAEVPLEFATTEHAFVAEGWIPTDEYGAFESALRDAVGDRVEVEELERAEYRYEDDHGHADETEAVTDGGHVTMVDDEPPTIQDNPGPARPFEVLVETINKPKYGEFDPTVILLLTFPAFYGFMIGDVGYGVLYTLAGYWLYTSFDSDAMRSLGGVTVWAGAFTILFGILYGEVFGLHLIADWFWGGSAPLHKGLQPADIEWARMWLVVAMLAGLFHMTVGYLFDFFEKLSVSFAEAMYDSGSWAMMMLGVWAWIFSTQAASQKPGFLYTIFDGEPFALGFSGLPSVAGTVGIAAAGVGLVVMLIGEVKHIGPAGILAGLLESLSTISDVLSYTRLAAVLLAKAGMAFVVNLLFFGVYVTGHDQELSWHFGIGGMPGGAGEMFHGHEVVDIMFPGLVHGGTAGAVLGLLVLVVGHMLVLALGVTSAGLQAVRLQYVEFFGKFYEGGGENYEPFGYQRMHTTED